MLQRWADVTADIPDTDKLDLASQKLNHRAQLCPEYSQEVYVNMRKMELT